MLCFVDESGDAGLKLDQGSSPFFTITAVIFEDHEDANSCDAAITELRRSLGLPAGFEFHYVETPRKHCRSFFECVVGRPFYHVTLSIDKANLFTPGFRPRDSFYKYASGLLFEKAKPYLDEAIIVLDGSGPAQFRKELAGYLKKRTNRGGSRYIHSVKIRDSKTNNLIQLADMVCGAVAEELKSKDKGSEFYKLIQQHEVAWQIWPKPKRAKK